MPSLSVPAASFEVFAESQLVESFFLAAHLRIKTGSGAGGVRDVQNAKCLVKTAAHLLGASLGASYAYAATGEIDLILHPAPPLPSPRGLLVQIAANASARHSLLQGRVATFDVRLYEFPRAELLQQYFRWRQDEAEIRLMDESCSEALLAAKKEASALIGMGQDEKRDLIRRAGVDWDALPTWQRRGAGVFWADVTKRREGGLVIETELSAGDTYQQFLARFL